MASAQEARTFSLLEGLPEPEANRLLRSAKTVRKEQYGAVHYLVEETIEIEGQEVTTNKYGFWARDNRYFRLDIERRSLSNSNRSPTRQRLIVRPEGFALLEATDASEEFAVTAFGNSAEGLDRLLAMPTVHASSRAYSILTIEDVMKNEHDTGGRRRLIKYKLDGSTLQWDSEYTSGASRIACLITCDVTNGVCGQYKAKTIKGEEISSDVSVEREFNFRTHRSIPISEVVFIRKPGTPDRTETRETNEVDWNPVDLSIFDITGTSNDLKDGSPWFRRIVAFAAGLSMMAAWLFYRHHAHRAGK